ALVLDLLDGRLRGRLGFVAGTGAALGDHGQFDHLRIRQHPGDFLAHLVETVRLAIAFQREHHVDHTLLAQEFLGVTEVEPNRDVLVAAARGMNAVDGERPALEVYGITRSDREVFLHVGPEYDLAARHRLDERFFLVRADDRNLPARADDVNR